MVKNKIVSSSVSDDSVKLLYVIDLILGDYSGDGHCEKETITIRSNIDAKALKKAYISGVKKTGVDWAKEVAEEYDDASVSVKIVNKLSKFGFKIEDVSEDKELEDGKYSLWTDGYTTGWLFIASVGDPNFRYEIFYDDSATVNIGGYGLFVE